MSRPQGVQAGSVGNTVDATICAHSGTTVERRYTVADLQRLREAGAQAGTAFDAAFRFASIDGRVAIDGELRGVLVLSCQRCLKPFEWALNEQFQLTLVRSETELDELDGLGGFDQASGGYEAVVADPVRLDLLALAEDQALLALPLVPRHASDACVQEQAPAEPAAAEGQTTQRPFGNLRDLLRGD